MFYQYVLGALLGREEKAVDNIMYLSGKTTVDTNVTNQIS